MTLGLSGEMLDITIQLVCIRTDRENVFFLKKSSKWLVTIHFEDKFLLHDRFWFESAEKKKCCRGKELQFTLGDFDSFFFFCGGRLAMGHHNHSARMLCDYTMHGLTGRLWVQGGQKLDIVVCQCVCTLRIVWWMQHVCSYTPNWLWESQVVFSVPSDWKTCTWT